MRSPPHRVAPRSCKAGRGPTLINRLNNQGTQPAEIGKALNVREGP